MMGRRTVLVAGCACGATVVVVPVVASVIVPDPSSNTWSAAPCGGAAAEHEARRATAAAITVAVDAASVDSEEPATGPVDSTTISYETCCIVG